MFHEFVPFFFQSTNFPLYANTTIDMHLVECLKHVVVKVGWNVIPFYLSHNEHIFAFIVGIPKQMF